MVKAIYPLSVEGGYPKGRGLASFFAAKPPSLSLPHAGKALFRKYRYPHPTYAPSGHLLPEQGGRIRLSYSKAFSPHRHFERKREIFFVRDQERL